ncbi:MAG: hypothetical protein ACLVH9_05530 [Fusobacterium sp.]|uniref:hypothetical protein n=1 Tax=Fusobacterium sp. TaxID=68766 RepID=UPI00399BFB2B
MYNNLILYRNELKNKSIYKYKIAGIVSELLFSKKIFSKNSDIKLFLKEVFELEFKEYVMKSRTLIVSHIIKLIYISEEENDYKKNLLKFINFKIEEIKKNENIKIDKNEFDGWVK